MSKKFQKVGQNFCEVWMRSVKGKYELQFPFGNIGYCVSIGTDKDSIQGDSDVFSIKQNLSSLHQGEHRFSHAFFTKVLHFRDNRKNVQF